MLINILFIIFTLISVSNLIYDVHRTIDVFLFLKIYYKKTKRKLTISDTIKYVLPYTLFITLNIQRIYSMFINYFIVGKLSFFSIAWSLIYVFCFLLIAITISSYFEVIKRNLLNNIGE